MIPSDLRNETWEHVQQRVEGLRLQVYRALETAGPCTTRVLAEKSGLDILTVRPRVTELYQLGLVELANPGLRGGEGWYQVVPMDVARVRFERYRHLAAEAQLPLL